MHAHKCERSLSGPGRNYVHATMPWLPGAVTSDCSRDWAARSAQNTTSNIFGPCRWLSWVRTNAHAAVMLGPLYQVLVLVFHCRAHCHVLTSVQPVRQQPGSCTATPAAAGCQGRLGLESAGEVTCSRHEIAWGKLGALCAQQQALQSQERHGGQEHGSKGCEPHHHCREPPHAHGSGFAVAPHRLGLQPGRTYSDVRS